jgi:hypothetical protein
MPAHRKPRTAFWWRRCIRTVALLAAAVAVFGTAAEVALAYWVSSGAAAGSATASTLNPPTGVNGAQTPGTGSVHVSWVAPTTGASPAGYYVSRKDSANNLVAACGTSASATISSTSCTDPGVPLGTYTYTVIAAYHSWTATSSPSASVTVAQAAQTITFASTAPTDAAVGGPAYTVSATGGGSGNPVTFSSATPTVCPLNGTTVSFPHAGTCTIYADQAGTTYYSPANTAQQSFTVAKASQVLSFTSTAPTNQVVGGPNYTVAATGGASGNAVVFSIDGASAGSCSIAGATVSFQHAGTCVVDANQAGNADYLAANQVQQSIAVGKGSQAITFSTTAPSSAQVGGSYTPVATSTSGLTVAITLDASSTGCTLTGGTVNFSASGTCIIDANQPGSADYLPAAQMQQSFLISKISQSITFTSTAPSNATVAGPTYTATATASSGLPVTFSSATPGVCTNNGAVFTFIAAGQCTVNADQAGNGTYNAAPQVQQSFAVAQAASDLTMQNGGTIGKADMGDSLQVQYRGQMQASTLCSSWTNSGQQTLAANGQVVVTITNNGVNDSLTVATTSGCTLNFGSVSLGADYVSASETFSGNGSNKSTVTLTTTGLLTITFGSGNPSSNSRTGVPASTPSYTPAAGLTDSSGTAIVAFNGSAPSRF